MDDQEQVLHVILENNREIKTVSKIDQNPNSKLNLKGSITSKLRNQTDVLGDQCISTPVASSTGISEKYARNQRRVYENRLCNVDGENEEGAVLVEAIPSNCESKLERNKGEPVNGYLQVKIDPAKSMSSNTFLNRKDGSQNETTSRQQSSEDHQNGANDQYLTNHAVHADVSDLTHPNDKKQENQIIASVTLHLPSESTEETSHQEHSLGHSLVRYMNNSLLIRGSTDEIFPTELGTLESADKSDLECNTEKKEVKDKSNKISESMEALSSLSVYEGLKAHRGICYVLISSCCYALLGVLIQLATSIHQLEAGVVRGIFLILVSSFGLFCSRRKLKVPKGDALWIVVTSVLNALSQITGFTAYSSTSVGDASAIMFSIPALSGVMAWTFLKERLTVVDLFATTVCLFGVFLVSKPSFLFPSEGKGANDNHFMGTVWAAITLIVLSAACVITRKLSYSFEYVYILTVGQGILATVSSVLLNSLIGEWSWPNGVLQVVYVVGIGVVGFCAIYFYNLSLQTEKALVVSILVTSSIFMSYVFQFALFKDFPDVVDGVGIVLLSLSVFAIFFQKWRISRAESRDAPSEPTWTLT